MFKLTLTPLIVCMLLWTVAPVHAQAPTGTITGTVTDVSGAVVPNANIIITNKATGTNRTLTANAAGLYSAPALPPGDYEVRVEMQGFRTTIREASVVAGSSTTVDLSLTVGESKEVVNVEAATAQISYDSNTVQGTITRGNIQDLPLNGRSSLQLASLEPGVTVSPGSTAQFNAMFNVSVLGSNGGATAGSGVGPLITMDGGTINDEMEGGTSMNFSQEIVQEFQIQSVTFDPSMGIAAGGGINIVTRSGSNDFHGSAYFFYRDHNMAAYPGLGRLALAPSPYFSRKNPGALLGGPIIKDRLFFFVNYEYLNQTAVLAEQEDLPSIQGLSGIWPEPYHYNLFDARFDYHVNDKHTVFLRYSHDGNEGFGPYGLTPQPANFNYNNNWSDQAILGVTSALSATLVNDLRFQFHFWENNVTDAKPSDCQYPCIGFGLPAIVTMIGSGVYGTGQSVNSPQFRQARSLELNDTVSWQRGTHRIRIGADYEHMKTKVVPWDFCDPGCLYVFAPEDITGILGALTPVLFPTLPKTIKSTADLENLPIYNLSSSIYSGIGVGNGTFPGFYEHNQGATNNRIHPWLADTWKVTSNLTINAALGYDYESGLFYSNLALPQYLAPILEGQTGGVPYGLGATQPNSTDFSPIVGFAWAIGKDKKTVIRGGAGMYWDTQPIWQHFREGAAIGPLGDGRTTLAASAFTNTIPGVLNLSAGGAPIPIGAALPINALTTMTLGEFMTVVNAELPGLESKLAPTPPASGAYTVSGIDVAKQGIEIYPSKFPLLRSYQTSIGVQRDLGHDLVITADWARRQGENNNLGELDLNHYARTSDGLSPVIPVCTPAQDYVPGQECSTGSITMWVPEGRSVYDGLLVKLQKRFSHRYQFQASYALQKLLGENAGLDLNNYFEGYGPVLQPQNFNVAGTANLPWGFTLSLNSSMISRSPVMPTIANIDFNGSGNTTMALSELDPSLSYNCFNSGCGKQQLVAAVTYFNENYAGKTALNGLKAPYLVLPPNYALSQPIITQDLRLTKTFTFAERYRIAVFGEFFNVLNVANITVTQAQLDAANTALPGYSVSNGVVTPGAGQTYAFGQATSRIGQVFGSGGPRAIQVGARFTF
ncbi:MAG TPA: carboxypeptidase regulatory-like domain-containing protein [Bryobacteraceae bacterium]|nr:carboxypeptidase regulatory-like domain-containing protein [Bryobacteraceae bacterium]